MAETSAERYLGKLISFVVPNAQPKGLNTSPWIAHIGEVVAVDGPLFRFAPCDYNQPHARLCEEMRWRDIRKIHDVKVVQRIG